MRFTVIAVLVGFSPLVVSTNSYAFADECVAPSVDDPGVHHPTGSDAATYTYQCDGTYAGLYYNGYYTYDPTTGATDPTFPANYNYDCTAQKWTMDTYSYSPGQKTFVKGRTKASPTPNLPTNCPTPAPVQAPSSNSSTAGNTATPGTNDASTVTNTGSGSSNNTGATGAYNTITNSSTSLNMSNDIQIGGISGDAQVLENTEGGNATSGDALSIATIMNLLQSSSNVLGSDVATFTAAINGDVNGDFIFDPSATIAATGADSQNAADTSLEINTAGITDTTAQITNNINVSAASGDAKVAGNTTAGDATSGNASVIVNLLNLINSTVTAGQSFVGTINITGNFNGDILLPQNFVDQLLAASGTGSSNTANTSATNNTTVNNSLQSDIANNVTSTATSGDATVKDNTQAGNAASGSANTGVTILNLTGSSIVGANNLLVFVNVLGTWLGMIVNAPAGSTAASLGGGITSAGNNSSNTASATLASNTTLDTTSTFGITNNVNVAAATGDATVKDNTMAGNATSGDANTAVNILNMTGSNLSLSSWFGVLFINVFGNWTGSFGVNTAAGNKPTTGPVTTTAPQTSSTGGSTFASFVPNTAGNSTNTSTSSIPTAVFSLASAAVSNKTAAAKTLNATKTAATAKAAPTPDNATHASYTLPVLGLIAALVLLLISERNRFFGKK